jgi:hypothetical protein
VIGRGFCLLAVPAVLAFLATPVRADRETAEFFAKRAERAAKAGDAAGALAEWRKATAEDDGFVPAHVGLGEALLSAGAKDEALVEFRAAVAAAAKAKPLPAGWADLVARAKQRLAEKDAGGLTLERIQRAYVDALIALADRSKAKDPVLAQRALRRAAEVLPEDPAVVERRSATGTPAKEKVVVFDGRSFEEFVPKSDDPIWTIADGVVRGGLAGKAKGLQTLRLFDADVDVKMEARLVKTLGASPKLAVIGAGGADNEGIVFGVLEDVVVLDEETGGGARRRIWTLLRRNAKPAFDPAQWTTYELRLRGDSVTVLVNGVVLRKEKRPKERREGTVGFVVQDGVAEVRKFEVQPH